MRTLPRTSLRPLLARVLAALAVLAAYKAFATVTLDNPIPAASDAPRVEPLIRIGKTLLFPITATSDSGPLSYTVTSSNNKIMVRAKTGNPTLKLDVTQGAVALGRMELQLFHDWVPMTTENIAGLAQGHFYDAVKFHRVVKGFIIQGGDPNGDGSGGPGFSFENEFKAPLLFTGRGQLAMANSGTAKEEIPPGSGQFQDTYRGSNGSQFFITLGSPRHLDFNHTIFGQLIRGWDVLAKIENVPVQVQAGPASENSKPVTPVTITGAGVEANDHDAVLVLSAVGPLTKTDGNGKFETAVITVNVEDRNGDKATTSFTVTARPDPVNSPPFLTPVGPFVAPKERQINFRLGAVDLEFDYLFFEQGLILGSENHGFSGSDGNLIGVIGKSAQPAIPAQASSPATPAVPAYEGKLDMGFGLRYYSVTNSSEVPAPEEPAIDQIATVIGVGDEAVRGEVVDVEGKATIALTNVPVGYLHDLDPHGAPGDFTATINWGDGKALTTTASVAADASRPLGSTYAISDSHTYDFPGIYPVTVVATGNKGATATIRSKAVISAGPLRVVGEDIQQRSAGLANRILATFTDENSTGRAADYTAVVDWGDGVSSTATIARAGTGKFVVRGSHTYKDPETFAVSVRVHRTSDPTPVDAIAWSTVALSGFAKPAHLPPFPQAHIVSAFLDGPTKSFTGTTSANYQEVQTGRFIVINSGSKKSSTVIIRFYLSADQTLNATGPNADIPLTVFGLPQLTASSIAPGNSGSGTFPITLPKGVNGIGKYLLSEVRYTDPVANYEAIENIVVKGPFGLRIVVAPKIVAPATVLQTTEAGGTATFTVALDAVPSQDVTIPLESSSPTEGTVSPSQLVFTPANALQPQTVTITGVDDATKDGTKSYTIRLKPSTSADPLFNAVDGPDVTVQNTDNEP